MHSAVGSSSAAAENAIVLRGPVLKPASGETSAAAP
jgi:hypothetical protein